MTYYKLKDIIFFVLWLGIAYFIFHSQVYRYYPTDLVTHLTFYGEFINGKYSSYPGFYLFTLLFDSIGLTTQVAAIIALTTLVISIIIIIHWTLSKYLDITNNEKLFLMGSLMIISAIYIPFFNHPYLGQGISNVWHNPTLFAVKPFAYLSFIVFMNIALNKGGNVKIYMIFALLLILSVIAKPNFIIFFVPSVIIYLLIYHRKDLKMWINLCLVSIPVGALIVGQYLLTYKSSSDDGIAIDPFIVWSTYSPNWFISFLLSVAFPLSLILFNTRRILNNRYISLAWICALISFAQFALLTETGPRAFDANWSWGIQISIPILFLYSTIEWYRWIKKEGESGRKLIVNTMFALHLISGFFYLLKILLGYTYM